ncbi:DUF1735 domain-containing protein [Bacteroides sp. OttesenSCG-928-D19]|nr:DUF1735 domain-containing protein [Bacteroides sp. OttesenSCG-928-N06]MDL2304710.1 DUF1735 domain-containing protein [Bacteroides sp. OttesenSCG-928-D19]
MKTIKSILSLAVVALAMAGCSEDYPLKEEQYKKVVYLTRAIDEVKHEYVNYAYERDTVYVSVSVSGSKYTDRDIRVTFREDDDAIPAYNKRNLSASDIQNRRLPAEAYEYPQKDIVIKAGETTAIYPVYIYPKKLHCDSLYMIPVSIESVSAYEMRTNIDTVLLAKINMVNNYSGKYHIRGTITNLEAGSVQAYDVPRSLTATNSNSVRMFHEVPETKTYLQTNTLTISVNSDQSLSFNTWWSFDLTSGGGKYLADKKLFDLWYEYKVGNVSYRVEGYLYEVPETELEQEDIDDWIDEQLRLKEEE